MALSFSQMMAMQQELYALHRDTRPAREPDFAKEHILYMVEEIGEAIAILKKKRSASVLENTTVRDAFLEEMADVLMFYRDVLLCFHVAPEEISRIYAKNTLKTWAGTTLENIRS